MKKVGFLGWWEYLSFSKFWVFVVVLAQFFSPSVGYPGATSKIVVVYTVDIRGTLYPCA